MAASERADPLTNEAPDGPRLTRFDWDKIAAEEAAKLELEEREEAEAAKRTSGADASSRDAPRSAAEAEERRKREALRLSLIHISEPTRRRGISYAVFCLKKKKK